MEEELESRGISIQEIWRVIKKKIWLILLLSLAAALAAVVLFSYWINPRSADYKLEFELIYPDAASQKYPDGTIFYYQDIISMESLAAAKESNARFAELDVSAMGREDLISIAKNEETGTYTISARQSYFEDRAQATAFLRALAQLPIERVKTKAAALDFSLSKSVFDGVQFEDKLTLLSDQKAEILARYDVWIAQYSGDYIASGKALKNYRTEASVVLGDVIFEELKEELSRYGYVSRELLQVKLAELREEREINDRKLKEIESALEKLRPANTTTNDFGDGLAEIIAELISRNVELDREIAALTEENVETFTARLDAEYEKLQNVADSIRNVASLLYEQESRANFMTSNATAEGGTSTALIGVGIFVLAFLIAGAAVFARGLPKLRAEEAKSLSAGGSEETAAESSLTEEKEAAEGDESERGGQAQTDRDESLK